MPNHTPQEVGPQPSSSSLNKRPYEDEGSSQDQHQPKKSKKPKKSNFKPNAPAFSSVFQGTTELANSLATLSSLAGAFTHEWPLVMRETIICFVYTCKIPRDRLRTFERYQQVRQPPIETWQAYSSFQRELKAVPKDKQKFRISALRVSRAIATCQWLRFAPQTNSGENNDVMKQLQLWELDHRIYFHINWPNGDDGRHPPENQDRINQLINELKAVQDPLPAPASFGPSFSQPPTSFRPSSFPQTQILGPSQIPSGSSSNVHQNHPPNTSSDDWEILRKVESFVVTDLSHVRSLDTIFGNEAAIADIRASLFVWVDPRPSKPPQLPSELAWDFTAEQWDIIRGSRAQSDGVILYGPSGTGKTTLLLAAVKESGRTLLSLTKNDLCSKWFGDSEKVIAETFALAKKLAPSAILIDEIDKVVGTGNNSEDFRMRVEGVLSIMWSRSISEMSDVVVLGATDAVKDMPKSILSRFGQRIKVDGLSFDNAEDILRNEITFRHGLTGVQLRQVAEELAPLGLRAIRNLAHAVLRCLQKRLATAAHFKKDFVIVSGDRRIEMWVPCDANDRGCRATTLKTLAEENELVTTGVASSEDCFQALKYCTAA
ncbi:MAG: hypothetical protein Q9216_000651 [Gyalolechia sp. 2 TL-2023]